jgi:hypothetical protein
MTESPASLQAPGLPLHSRWLDGFPDLSHPCRWQGTLMKTYTKPTFVAKGKLAGVTGDPVPPPELGSTPLLG